MSSCRHKEEAEGCSIQLAAAKDEASSMTQQLTLTTKELKKTKEQMEHQAARMERMQRVPVAQGWGVHAVRR